MRLVWILMGMLLVTALAHGCAERPEQTLTVLAAASLTEPFEEIAHVFEHEHPGVRVELSFASSGALRSQIESGAVADVFASASAEDAEALVREGLASSSKTFAYNSVVVAVPPNGRVHSLSDLAERGVRVVVASEHAPIGRYAREVLSRLNSSGLYGEQFERKVWNNVVSEEDTTKHVYAKVVLGEADAAFVYRTDITNETEFIQIPKEYNVRATYEIVVLDDTNPYAEEFEEFVLSPRGQSILVAYGFEGAGS